MWKFKNHKYGVPPQKHMTHRSGRRRLLILSNEWVLDKKHRSMMNHHWALFICHEVGIVVPAQLNIVCVGRWRMIKSWRAICKPNNLIGKRNPFSEVVEHEKNCWTGLITIQVSKRSVERYRCVGDIKWILGSIWIWYLKADVIFEGSNNSNLGFRDRCLAMFYISACIVHCKDCF